MCGRRVKPLRISRIRRWLLMAILLCVLPFRATAETVAAHHLEGTLHGYLVLRNEDGHIAAVGDLFQTVRGDRVTSHSVFHFKDGSLDDETTVFSQRGNFQLITDHHIQKGSFFPHPVDMSIDMRSGEVTVKSPGKDGKDEVHTEQMKLPADLCNGMLIPIAKNLRTNAAEVDVSMIVATPKPRLVKLAISPKGDDAFLLAGFERKAQHFEIKIELGGATGVVAPLIGKQPPNIQVWIEGGQIPGFVGEQGQIAEDSPIVNIEQTGPSLPAAAHASEFHAGAGN
jgi:hypothetical protein